MPGYKKTIGKRIRSKRTYKKKKSMSAMRAKTDDLYCHINLSDGILYNNLTSRALCLVNWGGQTAGTDTTFALSNSPEFTRNKARYRWFKLHKLKITCRTLVPMYEFDTARTGGIINMSMASSPSEGDVNSTSGEGLFQQVDDYKEVPATSNEIVKTVNLASFFKNHFNINDKVLTSQVYPNMWTGVRLNANVAGANASLIGTVKCEWIVSFHNRIPEVA